MKRILIFVCLCILFQFAVSDLQKPKLDKCLDLESVRIHKDFKSEFFKKQIFFPLGQKLDFGPESVVPHTIDFAEENKCFALTVSIKQSEAVEVELPFICNKDNNKFCCKLETKGTELENEFGLWGYARVTKTDNKSYMLVLTCVSHKKPSWVLLHHDAVIKPELREEILHYIEEIGFDRNELSSDDDPVSLIKIRKDKC